MRQTLSFSLILSLLSGTVPVRAADTVTTLPESRAEIVQIEAVVTDKTGALVRDLEQADFEVLDEGKAQVITLFARAIHAPVKREPVAVTAVASPPESAVPTVEEGRNVLFMVDDLHIALGGVGEAKKALLRVLDEFVAAEDQVSLVTTSVSGVIAPWTRDRAVTRSAIEKLIVQKVVEEQSRMADISAAQAELILGGDRSATELAGRRLLAEPGSIYGGGPQAALEGGGEAVGPGTTSRGEDVAQQVAEKEMQRRARGVLNQALIYSTRSFRGIEDSLRSLSRMPGRKICLLVSDGFLMGTNTSEDRSRDLQAVVDAAVRAGTVLYSLDSRGLVTTTGDPSGIGDGQFAGMESRVARHAQALYQNTLGTMAEQTGGFLVKNTNDFASGMKRMLEDNDAYYRLAFEPTNVKRDGRFHKVQVRVKRPGLTVRSGRGYFAPGGKARPAVPDVPAPLPGPKGLGETEIRALLDQPVPAGATPVHLSADFVDRPPSGSQALVRAHVDLASLQWSKPDAKQPRPSLEILGGVYDAQGQALGAPFAKLHELAVTDDDIKRARQNGLSYQQTLALPPGRYQVRVIARDSKHTVLGGASQWVEIPDLTERKLAMSSVFLSAASAGQDAAAWRDVQASRHFRRGDNLYFQLYVYNPPKDESGASNLLMQAQLRSAGKVVAASKPQPVALQLKDGAPVPETSGMGLEGLLPGPYELRVVVVDPKANASVQRNLEVMLE